MPPVSASYAEVAPDDRNPFLWFDRDLDPLDAPPVDMRDELLSEASFRRYVGASEQEEISRLAEEIENILF